MIQKSFIIESVLALKPASDLKKLIQEGHDVDAVDKIGMSAIHHVAALGMTDWAYALVLEARCSCIKSDNMGRFPFDLSSQFARNAELTEFLTEEYARQSFDLIIKTLRGNFSPR